MNGRIKRPEAQARKLILPRIGKIKIGIKGERFPTSVDYFIPTGKYAQMFTNVYGDKPQTIQIVFPSDNAEDVCAEYYEYRNDKGELIAKGDGETFDVWNASEQRYKPFTTAEYPNIMKQIASKYPNALVREGKDGWRVRLTLNFIIPMVRGVAGLWTFETNGSASTIPQVRNTFDLMLQERGKCAGVIFDLNVKYAKSQKPNVKSRYPVVSLVPNESEENIIKITEALKPVKVLENKNA